MKISSSAYEISVMVPQDFSNCLQFHLITPYKVHGVVWLWVCPDRIICNNLIQQLEEERSWTKLNARNRESLIIKTGANSVLAFAKHNRYGTIFIEIFSNFKYFTDIGTTMTRLLIRHAIPFSDFPYGISLVSRKGACYYSCFLRDEVVKVGPAHQLTNDVITTTM